MADVSGVELERRKKRREFYTELEQYYRRKWNATLKVPYISGRPVDFYDLYQKVTALGGWQKVSNWNRWHDVVASLNIPDGCAASEHGVKSIYMKYLARFEQSQLFGETDGENGDGPGSSLSSRSQRGRLYLSSLGAQAVASPRFASSILPDYIQSNIPSSSISNILETPHCRRLIRSLESGLPNEVDFAINICMILSSPPGHFSLRLNETPILIDLLLAHAGIFDQGIASYRLLYKDSWKSYPDRQFEEFWLDCIGDDDDILKLYRGTTSNNDDENDISAAHSRNDDLFGCLTMTPKEHSVLRKRIDQIANILRNFSFESECRHALANNRTMIRYLLIAVNSRNTALQSLALDTLGNIATETILEEIEPSLLRALMDTFSRCLHSDDKRHVIGVLETIGNLCTNERNEMLLCEYLEPEVIRRMIALLAVKDIMMCVYLLECLYQMTEMGPVPCQRIADIPRAVDTIVQLITVEAVSFGPEGLRGMKVVEYGMPTPHTAILPHPSRAPPMLPMHRPTTVGMDGSTSIMHSAIRHVRPVFESAAGQMPMGTSTATQQAPPPFLARPVMFGSALATSARPAVPAPTSAPAIQPQISLTLPAKKELVLKSTAETPLKSAAVSPVPASSQQPNAAHRGPAVATHQDPHVEQLTMNWIRQNCTADPGSHVSRGELYASYVQDMALHSSTAVLVSVFTTYVRQIFPSCTVRQLDNATNGASDVGAPNCRSTLLQFDGLKFRPKTTAKNSLISPASSSCSSPPLSQVVAQHPLMQQILSTSSSPEKSNSGLINAHTTSPVSSRAPSTNANISASATRARSNSAGTMDSGYSLPGTPDSLSSGFSGTNSSTGFGAPTSFASGLPPPPQQQQQVNSPKSPRKAAKVGGKKATRNRSSTPAAAFDAGTNSDNGLVNGSISNRESVSSTTTSAVCHLEVCHPAQEARTVIETGDSHEARIVRVENTIALVSSQHYIPDNNSSSLPSPLAPIQKPVNGALGGESSDNSNGCDPNMNASTTNPDPASNTSTGSAPEDVKPAKKKGGKKKSVEDDTTTSPKKKTKAKGEPVSTQLNGLVKQIADTDGEGNANATNSSASSPSLDLEAVSQNVIQSVQDVNKVLAEVKVEKEDGSTDAAPAPVTPGKKTPKKGGGGKKRKAKDSTSEGTSIDEQSTTDATPPKKKKYPKKKKVVEATSSPQKGLDDSFSQASTSSAHSSSGAASTPTPAAAFRLPLPPTRPQSPHMVQQPTIVTTTGANGQPVVVRIPPPSRLQYTCEWDGCGKSFPSTTAVTYHVCKNHINEDTRVCLWSSCDHTVRLRWSLIAHVQEVHCAEHALKAAALRRYEISMCGHSNIPEPRAPPPHPGYPPDAAIVAIRRHSLVNLPKEIVDENEGPVTKSIRLTSSLILRNLARYSVDGRRILRKHEPHLCHLAFSRLESSAALAQCLAELNYASASASTFNQQVGGETTSSGS